MSTPTSSDRKDKIWGLFFAGVMGTAILIPFALAGPRHILGLVSISVALLFALALLPRFNLIWALPLLIVPILTPQIPPGFYWFDPIPVILALLAVAVTINIRDKAAWEIHRPGWIAALTLLVPLLAVPTTVISLFSFAGAYKNLILTVALFFALRRIVPRNQTNLLLWVFPIVGVATVIQLGIKTRGLGGSLVSRLDLRNFYTDIGWGESNYIAAVLVVCVLGTLVLGIVERKPALRIGLLIAGLLMLQSFLMLFSRAATAALGVAAITLIAGWRGMGVIVVVGVIALLVAVGLATPEGQMIFLRFTDPMEYSSWLTRVETWEYSWSRFLAEPWTGVGLNQGNYQMDQMGRVNPHNLPLQMLMEQGVLGGLVFLVLAISIYRMAVRATPRGIGKSKKLLNLACIAMISAVIVNSLVEPTLSGYLLRMLFVWFVAWLALQDPTETTKSATTDGPDPLSQIFTRPTTGSVVGNRIQQ